MSALGRPDQSRDWNDRRFVGHSFWRLIPRFVSIFGVFVFFPRSSAFGGQKFGLVRGGRAYWFCQRDNHGKIVWFESHWIDGNAMRAALNG